MQGYAAAWDFIKKAPVAAAVRRCGEEMRCIAFIADDKELPRLLAHLGLPTDFPIIAPPRSPPAPADDESQVDSALDKWDGIDGIPYAEPFPA